MDAALASNNSIPKEFMNPLSEEPLEPLRVISKNEWTHLKSEFKKVD